MLIDSLFSGVTGNFEETTLSDGRRLSSSKSPPLRFFSGKIFTWPLEKTPRFKTPDISEGAAFASLDGAICKRSQAARIPYNPFDKATDYR